MPTRSRSWRWPSIGSRRTTPTSARACDPVLRTHPWQRSRTPPGPGRRGPGIAGSTGDDAEIVRVLNTVFLSLAFPSLLDQSLVRTADALARAERVGDPVLLFWAAMWRSVAAECTGDSGEMDRCDEIMASLVVRLGQPTITWCHRFMRVPRALIAGDTNRAEQFATEALQVGTDSGQPDINVFFERARRICDLAARHNERAGPNHRAGGCR